ncbi:MAG: putative baseplate assembly protein [Acidobacteria bacterium]|nr:putative baseplate assembly protein [Acidobacteriota bacterium]
MPLEAPNLDTRTFAELVRTAQLRIPRYTPEWTDFNESDPGNTLLQLFAWLTEMMLFQMNRVPDRNYIKFLQLLGLELRPAQPATAHLTFSPIEGAPDVQPVLPRSQIAAQPSGGGDAVTFETIEGLSLIRVPLAAVQVFDGSAFSVLTQANEIPGTTFRPFGWIPQVGSALYLGFAQPENQTTGRLFPQEMRFRVFRPIAEQAGQPQNCRELKQAPVAPVTLVWEYKPKAADPKEPLRWRRLNVFKDDSVAFTREGYINVQGPADIVPSKEGRITDQEFFWLRVRLADQLYPAGRAPVIDFIRPNTVQAESLSTVRNELAGISEGIPDQTFALVHNPIQPQSLELWIQEQNEEPEQWTRVDDFLASGAEDKHFTLNHVSGEIRFGDGSRGLIPSAQSEIVARQYRFGGGKAGNVPTGAISQPLTSLIGVDKVTNERPAVGGRDEQDVEELKEQAPRILRSQNRAVSVDDFAALATQIGEVAKAVALPLAHPDHPGVEVPGAITVVIVPDADIEDLSPRPSQDLISRVCQYLDQRRLLSAEVYIKGPEYQAIKVEARIAAQPYAAFDDVERRVIRAINEYLDPLGRQLIRQSASDASAAQSTTTASAQRGSGREIGRDLFPTSLIGVILRVADVVAVRQFGLIVNGKRHENMNAAVEVPQDGLLYGVNEHEINIEPFVE